MGNVTESIANDANTSGLGNLKVTCGTLTMSSSYATGGDSYVNNSLGVDNLITLIVGNAGGYVFEVDQTNSKILAYRQTAPADAGVADIALVEVDAAVDLSAVAIPFIAIGR